MNKCTEQCTFHFPSITDEEDTKAGMRKKNKKEGQHESLYLTYVVDYMNAVETKWGKKANRLLRLCCQCIRLKPLPLRQGHDHPYIVQNALSNTVSALNNQRLGRIRICTMKLSLLLLSLCVLFVAIEITPATSNYLRLRGESGASGASGPADASGPEGNSTNGTDEAEKLEEGEDLEAKMKTVQEKNSEHAKAKKKFDELRDLTAKSAEVSKDAAKDDAYSTRTRIAMEGSVFQNNRADKALETVRAKHKELVDAKMDAGMVVGVKPKGPCHMKRVIYEKRIKIAKARATELDLKSKRLKAKAEAAATALELKLKRANDAAAEVKDQSSHFSMDGRLDSARNATIKAQEARNEAAELKEQSQRAQDASDDALEDAMRIQKEMKAILDVCKNKQKFMKEQEKEMEDQEKADEGDKKDDQEKAAKAKAAEKKKEAESEEKKKEAEAEDEKAKADKKKEADEEKAEKVADDKKKDATDAKDKAEKPKVEAPKKKEDDEKVSAVTDKLSETEKALAKAKATIAKLKAAAAAKKEEKPKEEEKPKKKAAAEEEEEKPKKKAAEEEEEEKPKKSGKKVKGGKVDVEEESSKHAVIVSAKAKLSGNIKESEETESDSKDGKKTIVTSTAKHNRETVLEQNVPTHQGCGVPPCQSSVEKVVSTPDAEATTKDGMKKPTVVARGSLVQ